MPILGGALPGVFLCPKVNAGTFIFFGAPIGEGPIRTLSGDKMEGIFI